MEVYQLWSTHFILASALSLYAIAQPSAVAMPFALLHFGLFWIDVFRPERMRQILEAFDRVSFPPMNPFGDEGDGTPVCSEVSSESEDDTPRVDDD